MVPRFENVLQSRFCASCHVLAICVLAFGIVAALAAIGLPLASSLAGSHTAVETWFDAPVADFAATTRGGLPVEILVR